MIENKLEFLLRKNKGKGKINDYKKMFILSGFQEIELKHIELEKSDEIINRIKEVFPGIKQKLENLSGSSTYSDSGLLKSVFANANEDRKCYIFSDDVYYCGMYIVKSRAAQAHCLNVAKYGYSNTCFVLDVDFKFSFTINYYDENASELHDMFDVQLKILS